MNTQEFAIEYNELSQELKDIRSKMQDTLKSINEEYRAIPCSLLMTRERERRSTRIKMLCTELGALRKQDEQCIGKLSQSIASKSTQAFDTANFETWLRIGGVVPSVDVIGYVESTDKTFFRDVVKTAKSRDAV